MKIDARQAEAFVRKPPAAVRGVVVYGNDDGLIGERAAALAASVCEDLNDPFRVVDIAGETLKADPARLADEFGALALLGGRRVVRVRPAGEETTVALRNLVDAPAGDALIVVEGGNLTPRSALRALAESEPTLAALPCYLDNELVLTGLVESMARSAGLGVEPDALEWIVARLGGDRGQSRSEIDKLLLYKASDESKLVTLEDALAILGDTAAIGIDDIVGATFDGNQAALERALERVFAEGGNAVQLVRALQRHADQLHLVAGHIDRGSSFEAALFKARGLARAGPARQRFERHLRTWPLGRLGDALQAILKAERECKSTGYPERVIARRLCVALASSVPGRPTGR